MNESNVLFLGTQTGIRVYKGRDDKWQELGRQISGVADCLEGSSSFDGGQTWRQAGKGLPESMDKMVWALASPPNAPAQVCAGYGQSDKGQAETRKMPAGFGAVWFSPDVGDSWQEIELGELPPVRAMWIACC